MAVLLGCQEELISAQQFENIKPFINSEHKSSGVNVPSNTNSSLRVRRMATRGGNVVC